jgi:hypothetical protein
LLDANLHWQLLCALKIIIYQRFYFDSGPTLTSSIKSLLYNLHNWPLFIFPFQSVKKMLNDDLKQVDILLKSALPPAYRNGRKKFSGWASVDKSARQKKDFLNISFEALWGGNVRLACLTRIPKIKQTKTEGGAGWNERKYYCFLMSFKKSWDFEPEGILGKCFLRVVWLKVT